MRVGDFQRPRRAAASAALRAGQVQTFSGSQSPVDLGIGPSSSALEWRRLARVESLPSPFGMDGEGAAVAPPSSNVTELREEARDVRLIAAPVLCNYSDESFDVSGDCVECRHRIALYGISST